MSAPRQHWADILFRQGFGTRHECLGLLAAGQVRHGGTPVTDPQAMVETAGLQFEVGGVLWPWCEPALVLLHKPAGVECSRTPRDHPGVLELAPEAGSGHPEISWGDFFYYYAPDGAVPQNRQPYATIVTKDYPDDTLSRLGVADRWRLNRATTSAQGNGRSDWDPSSDSPSSHSCDELSPALQSLISQYAFAKIAR